MFTDSQAATARVLSDAPGPGQDMAVTISDLRQRLINQGNIVTLRWTPAHREVEGNEQADERAKEAAALPLPRTTRRRYNLSFLRRRATERATRQGERT